MTYYEQNNYPNIGTIEKKKDICIHKMSITVNANWNSNKNIHMRNYQTQK